MSVPEKRAAPKRKTKSPAAKRVRREKEKVPTPEDPDDAPPPGYTNIADIKGAAFVVYPYGEAPDSAVPCYVTDRGEHVLFRAVLHDEVKNRAALIGAGGTEMTPSPALCVRKAGWRVAWADEDGYGKKLLYNTDASALCLSTLLGPVVFVRK